MVREQWVVGFAANSGLDTTGTRPLGSIRIFFGNMPILQAAVYSLAIDQHRLRGLLFSAGNASLGGDPQIYLTGDNGDDHNDGADGEGSNCNAEVLRHGEITPYSRGDSR